MNRLPLTERDLAMLAESYITPELAQQAGLFRVDSDEGARLVGANGHGNYSGTVYTYYWPGENSPRENRLRRDDPDLVQQPDGTVKQKAKYLSPPGRGNMLYFPPGVKPEWLKDPSIPIVHIEGEKKTLAMSRIANLDSDGPRFIPIGLSGVWNWRGTVGKGPDERGARTDYKGVIPDFERIEWKDRPVVIVFDTNTQTNDSVRRARNALAHELKRRGAKVRYIDLPDVGKPYNGPDDLLALKGEEFILRLIENAIASAAKTEDWEQPATFSEYDLPNFPVDALSSWVKKFVVELARETQTPVDLAAMLSLAVCAGAIAGRIRIQARSGWIEPCNLYIVTAMEPGERKSAVFAATSEPLEEAERELVESKREAVAETLTQRRILEERGTRLEKEAAKIDDPQERKTTASEAIEIAKELAREKPPCLPRLICADTTPEALGSLLMDHDGRMCNFSPEGDLFDMLAGRYSGAPNFDVILKAHCGDPLRVDRRGRAEHVPNPALTIALAVQPDVIRGLVEKPGFRGRGLIARLLYSLPNSTMGHRRIAAEPLSEVTRSSYKQKVQTLTRLEPALDPDNKPIPHMLQLSTEAGALLREFETELEPQLAEDGDLGMMRDWAGKLAGAVLRIAAVLRVSGILSMSDTVTGEDLSKPISCDVIRRAISIGRYLIPHAKAAYAEMGADRQIEAAKRLLRWIQRFGQDSFTKREAHQANKSRFKKVTELDPALELLEAHGYIRTRASQSRKSGGRPSSAFDVNPTLFSTSQSPQNPQNPLPGEGCEVIEGFETQVNESFSTQTATSEKEVGISGNATPDELIKPTEPKRFVPRFTEEWRHKSWDSWKPPGFMEGNE